VELVNHGIKASRRSVVFCSVLHDVAVSGGVSNPKHSRGHTGLLMQKPVAASQFTSSLCCRLISSTWRGLVPHRANKHDISGQFRRGYGLLHPPKLPPPYSFLWGCGHIKVRAYDNTPHNIQELRKNMEVAVSNTSLPSAFS